jgi:hypothetical protein
LSSLFFVAILLMWPIDKSTGKIDRVCTPVGWFAFETMTTDAGPAPPVAGVVVSGILSSRFIDRLRRFVVREKLRISPHTFSIEYKVC